MYRIVSCPCELISSQFGHGFAQGFAGPGEKLPGGFIEADVRNVLTFPGF